MQCRHGLQAAPAQAVHQLKQAAGIGRDHSGGACRQQIFDLPIAELIGGIRLQQVEHARRTAAQGRLGDFRDLEFRNSRQQPPRLFAHALRMLQMTGVVICRTQSQRMPLRLRLKLAQDF